MHPPSGLRARLESLGGSFIAGLEQAGAFLLLFFAILRRLPILFLRPRLVGAQVHFLGNYSLAIILVSGLFVGLVLGLQGYYTLR
ncbi:MAG: ABC transporter permease, partial [Burkholderiaceae bacterium]